VKLIEIYRCLCDETRLRILHLLSHQPLCVCHFQAVLDAPQVKISKHLAYLRSRRLVQTRREASWIVYSLPANPPLELAENMKCLRDCCREREVFAADLRRMAKALASCSGPLGRDCANGGKPSAVSRRRRAAATARRRGR